MKLEQLLSNLNADDIKSFANKEVKKIVKGIKSLDVSQLSALTDNPVVESIRDNLNTAIDRVQDLELVEFAKGKVADTKNTVLSVLNVPSQVEVDNLTRKIVALEKKLQTMSKQSGSKSKHR